jgi:hypothetical protein
MSDLIKTYISPVTGRVVSLNTGLLDYVWLNRPSVADLREVIEEYEAIRIAEAWAWFATAGEGKSVVEGFTIGANRSLFFLQARPLGELISDAPLKKFISTAIHDLSIPRQRDLLQLVQPKNRRELLERATKNGVLRVLGEDFIQMLDESSDVDAFLKALGDGTRLHNNRDERAGKFARHIELLCLLRSRRYVLFPISYANLKKPVKWETASNPAYVGRTAEQLKQLAKYMQLADSGTEAHNINYANVVFMMSDATEIDDMSQPLIEKVEELATIVLDTKGGSKRGRIFTRAFRIVWNHRNPTHLFDMPVHKNAKEQDLRRFSGTFGWVAEKYPKMEGWCKPLSDFIAARTGRGKQAVIADLNYFVEFLGSLENPPATPLDVVRSIHIHDATHANQKTYVKLLEKAQLQRKRVSRMIGYINELFGWIPDWLQASGKTDLATAFVNPVSQQDRFKGASNDNPGQTFRTALPSWLVKEIRLTIESDDYAFMKSFDIQDWVNVFDRDQGQLVRTWWPGTSVCLLVLLELPLRTHQARWLDSGELDQFVVDAKALKHESNSSEFAIKGRRQGCIRIIHDTLRQETWLGLFVNTNKTALFDGKSPVGYEVPYLPPALSERLIGLREWGQRYLPPLSEPIEYNSKREMLRPDDPDAVDRAQKVPMVAPLFRHPTVHRGMKEPVTRQKLVAAYTRVLVETEKRVKKKYGVDISLTEIAENGELRWKYDLHTLRVSGISAMIENGVPLEVVSQFVAGHASLVMTLWYLKNSPGKLREAIEKAQAIANSESDFVGGEGFLEHIEKFAPFLLSKDGTLRDDGGDSAYAALKAHTGLWTINSDGICPGTSCATGGEQDASNKLTFGPVPGGRRCGLCRYWLTGPAFILGQVAEVNNLAYKILRNGQELAERRNKLIDLEDEDNRRESRKVRHHIEALERELTLDITEWQSRYQYAMSSSNLLDQYVETRQSVDSSPLVPAQLLTKSTAADLKLTLQATDEFVLIEHVTQMCDFMPGFKNREAANEKHLMLSKILEVNGLPQFLLKLDPQKSQVATNMLSSLILQYVQAQDIPRVLSGEIKLSDMPGLEDQVLSLAQAATVPSVSFDAGRRTTPIRAA